MNPHRKSAWTGVKPLFHWKDYHTRPSKMIINSRNVIDKSLVCSDFVPIENDFKSEVERKLSNGGYFKLAWKLWSAIFMIGVGIGVMGALQSILLDQLGVLSHLFLSRFLKKSILWGHLGWMILVFIPLIICAGLIVYFEPNAKGIGIARIFGYLNGINLGEFLSFRSAIVKYVCIILISVAGLPGGREEPFIHFGGMLAGSLAKLRVPHFGWRPYSVFCDASGRRDLVTAGTVAAVAVSFGTPIGAVLFCLEDGITFWNSQLTYIMFVCCVISTATMFYLRTLILVGTGYQTPLEYYMFFSGIDKLSFDYKISDVPIFILFGFLGSIFGTFWSVCYTYLRGYKSKFLSKKRANFADAIVFSILFFVMSVALFNLLGGYYCTPRYENSSRITNSKEMKVFCEGNTFESIAIYIFQDSRDTLKSLVRIDREGLVSCSVLLLGMAYYFVLSLFQSTTVLPSGILIPHLIIGASWGHLLPLLLYGHGKLNDSLEAKYTFFGALAQGSGITRFTLSLGVIMLESSGQTNFAFPIFVIVVCAKLFGCLLSEPIFRTVAYLNGYPLMRSSLLPISSSFTAATIMNRHPALIPSAVELTDLLTLLRVNPQEIYFIMAGKKVAGVIEMSQILTLLKTKQFQQPRTDAEKFELYQSFLFHDGDEFKNLRKKIKEGKYVPMGGEKINFEPYMHRYPYMIEENMSLRRIYSFFLATGAAYAIVVDNLGNTVGVIARVDAARFRKLEQFLLVRTEIVPIV